MILPNDGSNYTTWKSSKGSSLKYRSARQESGFKMRSSLPFKNGTLNNFGKVRLRLFCSGVCMISYDERPIAENRIKNSYAIIFAELEERTKQLKMMEERQSAERARREEDHKR